MKGPAALFEHEDNWVTRMGMVFAGERVVFRGKDLFSELRDIRWMELFLFGITGRRFTENQVRLFETIWTLGTSYPDPKIWNNRIASLAGTARSTCALGIGAAISISEATIYGRRPDVRAIDFLFRARRMLESGMVLPEIISTELKKFRVIAGYGRPMINADERIRPVREVADSLGFGDGFYLGLIFRIEEAILDMRYRYKLNAAALGAALAADQGLSTTEYYLYLNPSFIAGMMPCYIEASEKEEGTFMPMPCHRLTYLGRNNRNWSV